MDVRRVPGTQDSPHSLLVPARAKSQSLNPSKSGVLVLSGYGLRVAVERGHLAVSDGVGRVRREGRFHRATGKLRRLVVLGHSGTISFEALRWLHDVGCGFVQIDHDGELIVASGATGRDDPKLRRAQALAMTNEVGSTVARDLLAHKLAGQADLLDTQLGRPEIAATVIELMTTLADAESPNRLRQIEAEAAAAYWGAWSGLELHWAKRDAASIPEHWQRFGVRTSLLTRSPRLAINPANALLNYAYAILEAEARIAALAVGLDPGLGVLHRDLNARDSLALDLMEAVRPTVDRWVIDALTSRTFRKADFFETREGGCRLMPFLAKNLVELSPLCASVIAPVAEGIAKAFVPPSEKHSQPTPLTESNRRAGRPTEHQRTPRSRMVSLPAACKTCGAVLANCERQYCEACLPQRREVALANFATAGPAALAKRRAEGTDPAHTPEARKKQGIRAAANVRDNQEWEESSPSGHSDLDFTRDILPAIQSVPLSKITGATGLSLRYCSLIRRGLQVPHPRHWDSLAQLTGGIEARTQPPGSSSSEHY